jgi:hypothetical protein
MSAEGHDGAKEHIDAVQDILQPITNQEPTNGGLDIEDASEHRVLDQKLAGHAKEDATNDLVKATSTDEWAARASLDTVFGV